MGRLAEFCPNMDTGQGVGRVGGFRADWVEKGKPAQCHHNGSLASLCCFSDTFNPNTDRSANTRSTLENSSGVSAESCVTSFLLLLSDKPQLRNNAAHSSLSHSHSYTVACDTKMKDRASFSSSSLQKHSTQLNCWLGMPFASSSRAWCFDFTLAQYKLPSSHLASGVTGQNPPSVQIDEKGVVNDPSDELTGPQSTQTENRDREIQGRHLKV